MQLFEDINNSLVCYFIIDKRPTSLHMEQKRSFQFFKMVGNKGLGKSELFHYLGNRFFPANHTKENTEAIFIGEALG